MPVLKYLSFWCYFFSQLIIIKFNLGSCAFYPRLLKMHNAFKCYKNAWSRGLPLYPGAVAWLMASCTKLYQVA